MISMSPDPVGMELIVYHKKTLTHMLSSLLRELMELVRGGCEKRVKLALEVRSFLSASREVRR